MSKDFKLKKIKGADLFSKEYIKMSQVFFWFFFRG